MDAALLMRIGQALFGERWQTDLASLLEVNSRTMRRWASGQNEPPSWLVDRLMALINTRQEELTTLRASLTAKSEPDAGDRGSSASGDT